MILANQRTQAPLALKPINFHRRLQDIELFLLRPGLKAITKQDKWRAQYTDEGSGEAHLDVYRMPEDRLFFRLMLHVTSEDGIAGPVLFEPSGLLPTPNYLLVNKLIDLVVSRNN